MTYQTEFPDFDPATMPAIPAGFDDVSWHNDACPSFQNEASGLIIFIDYADKSLSELPSVPRFSLSEIDPEEEGDTGIAASDDWSEIQAHILARAFAANIEADLTASQFAEVKRRNGTALYSGGACATHDFCDANMNMQAAYIVTFGVDPLDDMNGSAPIWNRAWAIAKTEYLTAK